MYKEVVIGTLVVSTVLLRTSSIVAPVAVDTLTLPSISLPLCIDDSYSVFARILKLR